MVRVKDEIVRLEDLVESHRELLKLVDNAKRQLESTNASLVAENKRLRDQVAAFLSLVDSPVLRAAEACARLPRLCADAFLHVPLCDGPPTRHLLLVRRRIWPFTSYVKRRSSGRKSPMSFT